MKIVTTLLKIFVALAALAGVVYVIATYGDKIVAWAKKRLGGCSYFCDDDCLCESDCDDCTCDRCCDCDDCEEKAEEADFEEKAEEADFEG